MIIDFPTPVTPVKNAGNLNFIAYVVIH